VLAFSVLDAYYLALERAYRTLYQGAIDGQARAWTLTISQPRLRNIAMALHSPAIVIVYEASLLTAVSIGTYLIVK